MVRLNLLRIVRSICDPSDEEAESIRSHPLFDEVQRLAENDNAVLVRNMASELVKANLDTNSESSSGGRARQGQIRRTFTPPSLQHSMTAPMTPTHNRVSQSSAFVDGSVTPRRLAAGSNGSDIVYRPRSRDGPQLQMTRRTSGEIGSASLSKSRLPRTSMLRGSRSSLAAVTVSEDSTTRRENGVRLREQSRSVAASPAQSGGTAPQLNSKRRTRQPSGDIKWS